MGALPSGMSGTWHDDGEGQGAASGVADGSEGSKDEMLQEGDVCESTDGGGRLMVVGVDKTAGRVLVEQVGAESSGRAAATLSIPMWKLRPLHEGLPAARQMHQLLSLYLDHCSSHATGPHEGLVQGIQDSVRSAHAGSLREVCLDLSGRGLRDAELEALNCALGDFHSARCRHHEHAAAEDQVSSADHPAACPTVTVVDVSHNYLGSAGATALGAMLLRDFPFCEELYLDFNNVSDGIQHMFSGEGGGRTQRVLEYLKVLAATNNRIRTLRRLAPLPSLRTLFLDRNPLGPGLSDSAFSDCPKLTSLSLCSTTLNNLSRVRAALSHLTNLSSLWLQSSTNNSPAYLAGAASGRASSRARARQIDEIAPLPSQHVDGRSWVVDRSPPEEDDKEGGDRDLASAGNGGNEDARTGGMSGAGVEVMRDRSLEDALHVEELNGAMTHRSPGAVQGALTEGWHAMASAMEGAWDGSVSTEEEAWRPIQGLHDSFEVEARAVGDGDLLDGQTLEGAGLNLLDLFDAQEMRAVGEDSGHDAFDLGGMLADDLLPGLTLGVPRDMVLPNLAASECFYREVLIWHFGALRLLDDEPVLPAERAVAERKFCMKFERMAYGRTMVCNAVHALRLRECGLKPADRAPRHQPAFNPQAAVMPVDVDRRCTGVAAEVAGDGGGAVSPGAVCGEDIAQDAGSAPGGWFDARRSKSGFGPGVLCASCADDMLGERAHGCGVDYLVDKVGAGAVNVNQHLERQGQAAPTRTPPVTKRRCRVMSSALYVRESLSFVRTMCAGRQKPGVTPMTRIIASARHRPRQFEYNPNKPEELVLGGVAGNILVLNHHTGSVVGSIASPGAAHSILGLCWLRSNPSLLISGADNGDIQLLDVDFMRQRKPPSVYEYEPFAHLTSVHINSCDDSFLVSGYSNDIALYDLKSGKRTQTFKNLHSQHINVLKFANHSPTVFATSSFDRDVKMWDMRQGTRKPIFTRPSDQGCVMVCFSPDDRYLLSSAVDNEVRQYLAVDGRQVVKLEMAPLGSEHNYTRSYYMNGSDYIISGSCEESVVRVFCAKTGRFFRDVSLDSGTGPASLYIQSLRGDPFKHFHFSVLVAYNHPVAPSEMLEINMMEQMDPSIPSYYAG